MHDLPLVGHFDRVLPTCVVTGQAGSDIAGPVGACAYATPDTTRCPNKIFRADGSCATQAAGSPRRNLRASKSALTRTGEQVSNIYNDMIGGLALQSERDRPLFTPPDYLRRTPPTPLCLGDAHSAGP
jgi:hypothetical protein